MKKLFLFIFTMGLLLSCASKTEPSFTKEEIQTLSATNDYDDMLDALSYAVRECDAVKEEYLDGNLADKDAEQKIMNIVERYQPLIVTLENANDAGELNYKQHKKMVELMAELLGVAVDGLGKFLEDLGVSFE